MNYNKIDFVKHRKTFFTVSLAITLLGVLTLLIFGLNLGVEFKSGTSMDISLNKSITQEQAIQLFEQAGFEATTPTVGGENNNRVTHRFENVLNDAERQEIITLFTEFNDGDRVEPDENTVDGGMAREFGLRAIVVVAIASLAISLYVAIRFEWRFALSIIIGIVHDALIVVGIFSIFRLEVNLFFIAAVLTIIAYSINDTIVIFDRIRENLKSTKRLKTFEDLTALVNGSLRQTFTRSVNTTLTILFSAVCLYIFGSSAIKLFSLALIIGLISGAYSSIFISAQIWMLLKWKSMNKLEKNSAAS